MIAQTANESKPKPAPSVPSPHTHVERFTSSVDLLHLAATRPQIDGSEPFAISDHFELAVAPLHVLPPDATVHRVASTTFSVAVHATTTSGTLVVQSGTDSADVWASATSMIEATRLIDAVRARVGALFPAHDVELRIWNSAPGRGPVRSVRPVAAPTWSDIERNYPCRVARALSDLVAVQAPTSGGKLILFHGPPGTGKSTAIRAIARAWAPWCRSHLISDPEHLFSSPDYLTQVLTAPERSEDRPQLDASPSAGTRRWRLVIAEDTDEYLRTTARNQAGASLGRLLNLTDGILGDSHRVLVLLTTNEEIGRLHPALIRPGRCLARVEFGPFSAEEARRWLGDRVGSPRPLSTLAELFELRGDIDTIVGTTRSDAPNGMYL